MFSNIAITFNKIKDQNTRFDFLLSIATCTLYAESFIFMLRPGKNDIRTWRAADGDMGPYQAFNDAHLEDKDSKRIHLGNGDSVAMDHNEEPKRKNTISYKKIGSPQGDNKYKSISAKDAVFDKNQDFSLYFGPQKILSNFACQKDKWNLQENEVSCVSLHNNCYNHFGSHMKYSQNFTSCMKNFVHLDSSNNLYFDHAFLLALKNEHLENNKQFGVPNNKSTTSSPQSKPNEGQHI